MKRALRTNRVPAIDQVAKIRQHLSGHPLLMVPDSVKLAKSAFETLKSRYGDEDRVVKLRVKELKKTGSKPAHPKEQVAWFTDLLGKLQRLLEIGQQNDDLARVAFGEEVFSAVLNLFPDKEIVKLGMQTERYGKYTEERLEKIIRILDEWRNVANFLDKTLVPKEKTKDRGGGTVANTAQPIPPDPNKSPFEHKGCRICKFLSSQPDNSDLYLDHLGLRPYHCPKFIAMSSEERVTACMEAKICMKCLSPTTTYTSAHGRLCTGIKPQQSGQKSWNSC